MKKTVMKQIKEMTDKIKPDMLPPCEPANMASPKLTQACQQFGQVFFQQTSPEKCYVTGKDLEVAEPGERATAVLLVVVNKGKACTTPMETLTCELVSEITGEKIDCSVKRTEASQYEISYQPTSRGRHQLHIKVEGEHIKDSPFAVTVLKKFETPIKTITGVKTPWGHAVNQRGEIVVDESDENSVAIFSSTGEKLQSFGSPGSGHRLLKTPLCVIVDDDGSILITERDNCRIQKFTSDAKFIRAVGKKGNKPLEFDTPIGIAIHSHCKKVYVADNGNHHIQILNPDLTFSSSKGSKGSDSGQFNGPTDVAFDSTGIVYVTDFKNGSVHVITAEGQYLRQFRKPGGKLGGPTSISIDRDNVVDVTEYSNNCVSVFTCEGKFLTSFGTKGSGPGQFSHPRGIAVDKNGVVYVSDHLNNHLQLF